MSRSAIGSSGIRICIAFEVRRRMSRALDQGSPPNGAYLLEEPQAPLVARQYFAERALSAPQRYLPASHSYQRVDVQKTQKTYERR
jgi:hypothetical protein